VISDGQPGSASSHHPAARREAYLAEPIFMNLVCVHQCIHAKSATMKRRKASRQQGDMGNREKKTSVET